jgi:glycosyltransferase involved in cell wall biosynthesis
MFNLFDVFIHVPVNKYCEAFGQVYIEALASGVPSIFTLSGIAAEFIKHEHNALVVEYCNSHEIYNSLMRILIDSKLKNILIENGKKDVLRDFGLKKYIQQLTKYYDSMNHIENIN